MWFPDLKGFFAGPSIDYSPAETVDFSLICQHFESKTSGNRIRINIGFLLLKYSFWNFHTFAGLNKEVKMALIHEFEKTGNWLFKRRSWLPAILVVSGLIVMYYVNRQSILFSPEEELLFLGVSFLGQAIRVVTVGFVAPNTSGRNTDRGQVAEEINVTGIYSLLRHPLYLGNYFMWLGPTLFLRSVWFLIVFSLAYWLYYERIMFAEEQFLRRKFGDSYDKWSEKVRAFIPDFRGYLPPKLSFSFRIVLRREYNSFINIFVIFTLLDLARNYFISERIFLTPLWAYLIAGAGILWIILRTISKKTSWLVVEKR